MSTLKLVDSMQRARNNPATLENQDWRSFYVVCWYYIYYIVTCVRVDK